MPAPTVVPATITAAAQNAAADRVFTVTVGAEPDPCLVVCTSSELLSNPVASVSWSGNGTPQAFTQQVQAVEGINDSQCWTLLNPTSETNGTITVTMNGGTDAIMGAFLVQDVASIGATNATTNSGAGLTSLTASLTTLANDSLIVLGLSTGDGGVSTNVGTKQTERWDLESVAAGFGSMSGHCLTQTTTTAGLQDTTVTFTTARRPTLAQVELQGTTGGTVTGTGDGVMPAFTGAGSGSVTSPANITGTGDGVIPAFTGTGVGTLVAPNNITGSGDGIMPGFTGDGSGDVGANITGTGDGTMPGFTGSGLGAAFIPGSRKAFFIRRAV